MHCCPVPRFSGHIKTLEEGVHLADFTQFTDIFVRENGIVMNINKQHNCKTCPFNKAKFHIQRRGSSELEVLTYWRVLTLTQQQNAEPFLRCKS